MWKNNKTNVKDYSGVVGEGEAIRNIKISFLFFLFFFFLFLVGRIYIGMVIRVIIHKFWGFVENVKTWFCVFFFSFLEGRKNWKRQCNSLGHRGNVYI